MVFLKESLTNFSGQIVLLVLGITTSVLTARVLGPSGKGVLSVVLLLPTILVQIGSISISNSNVYFLGKKKYTLNQIFWNSLFIAFVFGGICIIFFFIFNGLFRKLFINIPINYLHIVVICVPLGILLPYLINLFLSMQKIVTYNVVKLSQPLVFIVLFVILSLLFHPDVSMAAISYSFSFLMTSIIGILLLRKKIIFKATFSTKIFKDTLSFGFKGHLGSIADYLNRRFDIFIISTLLPIEEVGYYAIAVTVSEMLWYIPKSIGSILFNKIALSSEQRESNNFTAFICRNALFLLTILGLFLLLTNKIIIELFYGAEYLPSISALLILIPGIIISGIKGLLVSYVNGIGKPIISTISAFIGLGINLPLNYLLIPKIGIAGAALATTISYIISSIYLLLFFKKISNLPYKDIVLINHNDITVYRNLFSATRLKLLSLFK